MITWDEGAETCWLNDWRKTAAFIETSDGPRPICAEHIPTAKARGYTVTPAEKGVDE